MFAFILFKKKVAYRHCGIHCEFWTCTTFRQADKQLSSSQNVQPLSDSVSRSTVTHWNGQRLKREQHKLSMNFSRWSDKHWSACSKQNMTLGWYCTLILKILSKVCLAMVHKKQPIMFHVKETMALQQLSMLSIPGTKGTLNSRTITYFLRIQVQCGEHVLPTCIGHGVRDKASYYTDFQW